MKITGGRLRGHDGVVAKSRKVDGHEYALLRVDVWGWFDVDVLALRGGVARRGRPEDASSDDSFLADGA